MVSKRLKRKDLLRDIVRQRPIRTQMDLVNALATYDVKVTQATVSRDVAEVGLRKSTDGYYVLPEDMFLRQMVAELVTKLTAAQNLVVVKTASGSAQAVAAALDGATLNEIVGCIAGDDTILLVCADNQKALRLLRLLESHRRSRPAKGFQSLNEHSQETA